MNVLLEKGLLIERPCGNGFAYALTDNSYFAPTEYKVFQSKEEGVFIKCMKIMYNGKIQFCYIVSGYKPFSEMVPSLDADSFMAIAANIFADVIDVKNYGFLSCKNIDASFEKIYVDPNTYRVKLVYLPSNKGFYQDEMAFENELRTGLVKLISSMPALSTQKTGQFMADLTNGMYSVSDIYNRIKGVAGKSNVIQNTNMIQNTNVTNQRQEETPGRMRLVAMNAPSHMELNVAKDVFVIGKKAEAVDGLVSFNKMISRIHCRIEKNSNGEFTITDLQSANGTFLNRSRLQANVPQSIKNGDIIRLADSDFQVVMGG